MICNELKRSFCLQQTGINLEINFKLNSQHKKIAISDNFCHQRLAPKTHLTNPHI